MAKLILTLSCIVLLSTLAFAGNTPAAVQKAFERKFPNATGVKWDKENVHEYEASFKWKGENHSANFTDSGEWLETETTSVFTQLPDKVQTAFTATHKGVAVKTVAKIDNSKGVVKYEIETKQGGKTIELFYSEDGMALKN